MTKETSNTYNAEVDEKLTAQKMANYGNDMASYSDHKEVACFQKPHITISGSKKIQGISPSNH